MTSATLDRLAFIFRAKQLGCSLDEIADLMSIWDGRRCGLVQRRFHELVTDKLRDAQGQIAALTAFTDQLRGAAERLGEGARRRPLRHAWCACLATDTTSPPAPTPVSRGRAPSAATVRRSPSRARSTRP